MPDSTIVSREMPLDASPPRATPLTLQEIASQPDEQIDLALGAALIARDVYGNLDVAAVRARFDELAAPLVRRRLGEAPPEAQAAELAHHIYEKCGFRGNEADYYDPRNSLLPDVLERKLGIPITLAIVYCEVARRLGIPANGVAFPGHFLVRIERAGMKSAPLPMAQALIVDPFFGGRVLEEEAILRLLRRALGPKETLRPEHLAVAPPRAILVRILTNLKAIHLTRGDHARAHLALDRIVSLTPDAATALRERGLLAARLGAIEAARADLTRVLELEPNASDASAIQGQLAGLSEAKRSLN
jgi:regulator of sirC expression with transglutaminase-like and TPR domain